MGARTCRVNLSGKLNYLVSQAQAGHRGGDQEGSLMKRVLLSLAKTILPVSARVSLKRLGYRMQDVISPIREPRVPPRAQTLIGGGDFAGVGDHFAGVLRAHGLTPDMDVLDVGCGQGRMARPLVGFFEGGSYTGLDIDRSGIDWCQTQYADVPNFTFAQADVFNARYNSGGSVAASDYVFPSADDSFDRVFLTSVFTHMFADDVENYLSEIARVLRPGGQALITWFLWDASDKPAPVMDFHAEVDAVSRTTLPENPEAALAFDREWVEALYARLGLQITEIALGGWREGRFDGLMQDLVVAKKS